MSFYPGISLFVAVWRPAVIALWMYSLLAAAQSLPAANGPTSSPADLPDFHWHLTARPWKPVNMPESDLLDQMEKAIRAMAPMQYWNAGNPGDKKNGAIIDPIDKRELQYGTPLFAFNVATMLTKGRAADLVVPGIRALDRATLNISTGKANDSHGEFFCTDGEGDPHVRGARVEVSANHARKAEELEGTHEDKAQRPSWSCACGRTGGPSP